MKWINLLIVILVGRPGSGKETLIRRLMEIGLPIEWVSMSQLISDALKNQVLDTWIRESILNARAKGRLVPDYVCIHLFREYMKNRPESDKFRIMILDGVIRTIPQVDTYLPILRKTPNSRIVILENAVGYWTCFWRMYGRRRENETVLVILRRLYIEMRDTSPAVFRLKRSGLPILKTNGEQCSELVVSSAKRELDDFLLHYQYK